MSLKVAQMNMITQPYMFSKHFENFRKKVKSNRSSELETTSAQFTELRYTTDILIVNRSKTSQKNMKL